MAGLLAVVLVVILGVYIYKMQRAVWLTTRTLLVVATLFALTALAARLLLPLGRSWVCFSIGDDGITSLRSSRAAWRLL